MRKIGSLEGLRGLCAVYVFLGHFMLSGLKSEAPWVSIMRFGQEAVIVFFLLSGFVIALSTAKRPNQGFGEYFKKRALRIYPIFFLAILISFGIAYATGHLGYDTSLSMLLRNVLMLQDGPEKPGTWAVTFAGDGPLWSLSYEWWFYMMFWPIRRYIPREKQVIFVAALALVGLAWIFLRPAQPAYFLCYFPIWWCGVVFADSFTEGSRPRLRDMAVPLLTILSITIAFVVATLAYRREGRPLLVGFHPVLEARHFGIALVLILAAHLRPKIPFDRLLRPFERVAPFSYALYVTHWPLTVASAPLFGSLPLVASVPIRVVLAVAFSMFAEGPFQRSASRLFGNRPTLPQRG